MFSKFRLFTYDKLRVELFSDAVFAIVITLLILEIKVPPMEHQSSADIWNALLQLKTKIFCWIVSFLYVGVGWVQHHNILHMTKKTDLAFIWMNIFCLMGFCFVPFATAFMGESIHSAITITLFCITLSFASLMMCLLYRYIVKYYLKDTYNHQKAQKNVLVSFIAGPPLYLVAAFLSWLFPMFSAIILLLVPVFFIFPLDKESEPAQTFAEH